MSLVLSNARVVDLGSSYHNEVVSLTIENGEISKIDSKNPTGKGKYIDLKGAIVTPGFLDISCSLNDPGLEYKEDINSGLLSAAHGGFTAVCAQPNTSPVVDSKSSLEYLISKSKDMAVTLLPVAAISRNNENESLSELIDLFEFGAVAFSGGIGPINNSELLLNGLRYSLQFGGLVMNRPQDLELARFGQMHEGETSTRLGLKGISDTAECVMIRRDLDILRYTGGKLHFNGISSAKAVDIIKGAKQEGLRITCDVPIHNLIYTDQELVDFDTNFKVNPPLRSEKDRKALIKGVKTGVIDAISSDHQPQDTESKKLEYDLADFGMIGFQTVIPYLILLSKEIKLEILFEKLSNGPRSIIGFDHISIAEGQAASLTIIDEKLEWDFNDQTNMSKSNNSPSFGKRLTGRSIGIINGKKYWFAEHLKA